MNKFSLNCGIIMLLFIFSLVSLSSCSKNSNKALEEIDVDNIGHFSIMINDDEFSGTEVYNSGGLGVRTINANSEVIDLNLVCLDTDFKVGSKISIKDSENTVIILEYTFDGEQKILLAIDGYISVESLSKITIDATFIDSSSVSGVPYTITGFVSSK